MSDNQLAAISEFAARYFLGWKAKPIGVRRYPKFEQMIVRILRES